MKKWFALLSLISALDSFACLNISGQFQDPDIATRLIFIEQEGCENVRFIDSSGGVYWLFTGEEEKFIGYFEKSLTPMELLAKIDLVDEHSLTIMKKAESKDLKYKIIETYSLSPEGNLVKKIETISESGEIIETLEKVFIRVS